MGQMHYLPLNPWFFAILLGLLLALAALIEVGVLRYAYMRLGLSSRVAIVLLLASLIGSYVNIPVVTLPERQILPGQEVEFFGMRYAVPVGRLVFRPQN